jgi:hypothetical protein
LNESWTLDFMADTLYNSAASTAPGQRQRTHLDRFHGVVPDQNAFIERFNKTCRDEVLDAYVFESIEQVRMITDAWLREYNEERPHDSLGRVLPLTFMSRRATLRGSTSELYS